MSRTRRKEKTKPVDEVEKKQNREYKTKKRQGIAGNLIKE